MSVELITPTWRGDCNHFLALRHSIAASGLAPVPHRAIVQTEDAALFADAVESPVQLTATAAHLPDEVERRRVATQKRQARTGHRLTKLAGSLSLRLGGWPQWVRYTGWHVQQITKLAAAAESTADAVVVLDCDVVVLPQAEPGDFLAGDGRAVCLYGDCPAERVGHRQARWNRQAHALLEIPFDPQAACDGAFDTPFVFHPPLVRAMLDWLSQRYGMPCSLDPEGEC